MQAPTARASLRSNLDPSYQRLHACNTHQPAKKMKHGHLALQAYQRVAVEWIQQTAESKESSLAGHYETHQHKHQLPRETLGSHPMLCTVHMLMQSYHSKLLNQQQFGSMSCLRPEQNSLVQLEALAQLHRPKRSRIEQPPEVKTPEPSNRLAQKNHHETRDRQSQTSIQLHAKVQNLLCPSKRSQHPHGSLFGREKSKPTHPTL